MSALNDKALGQYMGNLYITPTGWTRTDMWAVRALVATLDNTNVVPIPSDNRWTLMKFVDLQATITVTLLETQDRDKLNLLFNTTSSNVAGTPTAVTGEVIGTDVAKGTVYNLVNKNGDNTIVSSIVVSDTGGALVLNTDYTASVDSEWNTRIVFLADTTGATDVDYSYTPNDTENAVINVWTNTLKNFLVEIEAVEDTKVRKITLSSATINSTYGLGFTDVVENGDVIGADITFEANKGSTFTYSDQILA